MRYEVAPLPDWSDVDGRQRIRVGRHHRVPVEGGDLLVVPHGRPGWLRIPAAADGLLDALDGISVAELRAWDGFERVAGTVRALYDGGLLFVGGRTGLRSEPAPRDPDRLEPPTALLLKLTGACDLACDYCYDYDAARWPGRMSQDLARQLIAECLQPGRTLTVMFHGGEPMLRFAQIRELVAFAEDRAAAVGGEARFTLQTNGLHFTPAAVDFLREHAVTVGVSLDGSAALHDRHRVDARGRGSHARIMAAVDRYPDYLRTEVGYLSVVGADLGPADLDEAWRFFRELGVLSWKLLPADAEGRATGTAETAAFRRTFVDFLATRLDAVLAGDLDPPYLTNLVQLIDPFLSLERPNMCMSMPCGAGTDLLVLDAVGAVRACDCTYHPAFELVPAGRATLPLLVGSSRATPEARALRERERWLVGESACAGCPWLHHCGGTCPARALMNNGSLLSIDDLECSTRLALFPRILADVSGPDSLLHRYAQLARSRAGAGLTAGVGPP